MKWRRIAKSNTAQPTTGTYSEWKPLLAAEALHQCVYCCICDAHFGGIRNFHVEHFRPKKKFPDLELAITNLYYSCSICNVFKSDDWPDEPGRSNFDYPHYPDPSVTNYSDFLTVDAETAEVVGENIAAKYLVEKLHLNRPQIRRNRKLLLLSEQLIFLQTELEAASDLAELADCREAAKLIGKIARLFHSLWNATPYDASETR